jgi:4-amino-4-deoxy-L-arabinose transferase-like glycosyltransferase
MLFLLLRLRWRDHLLMWDEAMNLCAARAFAAGGHDAYSDWFWRYPPLHGLLLMLAHPLSPGFAGHAEWIALAIGLGSLLVMGTLNWRTFGAGPAIASCVALAVMPGSIFHGLWIKQDHLMTLAGLGSLLFCGQGRWIACGLTLGIALLSKQTAAFFAIALAIILLRGRSFRPLLLVAAISFLAACWWYALFSTSEHHFLTFMMKGTEQATSYWNKPWHYYPRVLWRDLGPIGAALASVGLAAAVRNRSMAFWPPAFLVPCLAVLTLSQGKTPWHVIMLYPALATLQGIGVYQVWRWLRGRFATLATTEPLAPALAAVAAAAITALPVFLSDYEQQMYAREPGMWDAAYSSRQAAVAMNERVQPGESALITPMHYYEGLYKEPCPIFVIYLKDMPVVVRPFDLTASDVVHAVRDYRLRWAMVSPEPGRAERELIGPLMRDFALNPVVLHKALIYDTRSLLDAGSRE